MLVRSAGRRHRRHTSRVLAASFAQLQLPWLAPAQLRWAASQASSAPSPAKLRRRSLSKPSCPTPQLRQLGTAADRYPISYEEHFSPPPTYGSDFHNVSSNQHAPWDLAPSKASAEMTSTRMDGKPVIINTTTLQPSTMFKVLPGVSGNARDLLAHYFTSLSIGRRDRAATILSRLSEQKALSMAELSHAHAAYLQELYKSLVTYEKGSAGASTAFRSMRSWFDTTIQGRGIPVNGRMLVAMIRAVIRERKGSDQEKAIRNYSEMARSMGPEIMDDVLFSEDYSDEEFTTVGRITSDFFEPEEEPERTLGDVNPDMRIEPSLVHPKGHTTLDITNLPEVLPTPQKGLGLAGVKRAVESLADAHDPPLDASAEARRDHALAKQQRLEHNSVEVALERWRKADEDLKKLGINTVMQTKSISALMWQWYQSLLPALEKELEETREILEQKGIRETDRHHFGPYLELLSLPKVAASTILFTMSKLAPGKDYNTMQYESEVKLSGLTMGVARVVEEDQVAEASVQRLVSAKGRKSNSQTRHKDGLTHRHGARAKSRSMSDDKGFDTHTEWPLSVKVKLGAMLISKLMETAELPVTRTHPRTGEKVTQMQPAFLHRSKYIVGKKVGLILPNPALTEKMQSEPLGSLIAKRMPMVVEPKPWKGWRSGGYLHYSNPILRLPIGDKSGRDYFMAADRKGDLERVYAGLNSLGKVPWMVHPDVFRVQLEAWNTGEAIANFAPLNTDLDLPPEPDATCDPNVRRAWFNEVKELQNKKTGLHSKRCFQNFQLEVARSFLNETLYFPHNLDFRGRAYPIPPYLNHMGADNVRGLLTFAEGKPLGPDGLRWLKIHLATVAGHDKASMEERVEFTMSHLDDIYDSVRSPLAGRRWWLRSEDAWQTLAACFELTRALDSPDPTQFISHLPIQQDGTCNGLQHYAALGGDKIGAAQVNLEPGDRPSDVYTAVAEAVKQEIRQDAAQGNEVARKLDGHITRKCVKQPVMTNVYGVTYYGARQQVRRQLEAILPHVKRSDEINHEHMSSYVADKIFKCLGSMFSGAQAIQTWLGQCADRVTTCLTPEQIEEYMQKDEKVSKRRTVKSNPEPKTEPAQAKSAKESWYIKDAMKPVAPMFKSTVVWTTPLGLPVVQPYRKAKTTSIFTNLQSISMLAPQVWDPVSRRKQLQAFPPNFIHSLDSTHMLLSANKCNELGLTFASIHDSFWTHACDVNTMGAVLRDAFVSMHSEDIIGRLREEFQARFKGAMYMASVRSDTPLGEQIRLLRKTKRKELAGGRELRLEVERLRLLDSGDPEQRAKGEAMVTPASVFAAFAEADTLFDVPTTMQDQTLGKLPPSRHSEGEEKNDVDGDEEMPVDVDEEAPIDSESADEIVEAAAEDDDIDDDGSPQSAPNKKKRKLAHPGIYSRQYVWLPMTFPEVPAKGDFDVKRLRESKYFFH